MDPRYFSTNNKGERLCAHRPMLSNILQSLFHVSGHNSVYFLDDDEQRPTG